MGEKSDAVAGPELEDRDPRKPRRSRRKRRGGGRLRVLRAVLAAAVLAGTLGIAGVAGLFVYFGGDPKLPKLDGIADYRPRQILRVLDRHGRPLGTIGDQHRSVVPVVAVPKVVRDAVLAAEDPDFYRHGGLDYRGMARAFVENVLRGRFAQGGSTITQQVVKGLLLSPEKSLRRKVQEIVLARRLSQRFSKDEVLQIYLNQNYYGHGRYGCDEAARYYFGKPIGEVTLGEAAVLAGLPQSPERLSPRKYPDAAKTRQRYVLGQMARHGMIDAATAARVAAEPILLAPPPGPDVAPEAIDRVARELRASLGEERLATMGGTLRLAIDRELQMAARETLERGLEDLDRRQGYAGPIGHLAGKALDKRRAQLRADVGGKPRDGMVFEAPVERVTDDALYVELGGATGVAWFAAERRYADGKTPLPARFRPGDLVRVRAAPERKAGPQGELAVALELGPQAAMVVMDPRSREILALVGGYGYRAGGFDRSQRARRQPGSAFKPFVYGAAIDSGQFTAASIVNDAPEVYDLWKPQNYDKDVFRGPVRLRVALADSINTVAIKLLAAIGLPALRDFAARAGITSAFPEDVGLSAALGSLDVTPLELANAYATLAAGGLHAEPFLLGAIGGEAQPPPTATPAIRPGSAYVVVSLLRSVVDEGTARAAGARLRRPLAGKTGTSNGQKDAWFVGFSPDLLAAVWVGFDDGKSLGRGEAGSRSALPIWTEFMAKALAARPALEFTQPPGVVVARIDPTTGLLAPSGAGAIDEVFIEGTVPGETPAGDSEAVSADKLLLRQP